MASYDELYAEARRRARGERDVVMTALLLQQTKWEPPLTPLQHVREALIERYLEESPASSKTLKARVVKGYHNGDYDNWSNTKGGLTVMTYLARRGLLKDV